MISHEAVLVQAESLAHARYLLTADDAFWCPLPLFHNGGLATLSACLASGATYVHTGAFEPTQALHMRATSPTCSTSSVTSASPATAGCDSAATPT